MCGGWSGGVIFFNLHAYLGWRNLVAVLPKLKPASDEERSIHEVAKIIIRNGICFWVIPGYRVLGF